MKAFGESQGCSVSGCIDLAVWRAQLRAVKVDRAARELLDKLTVGFRLCDGCRERMKEGVDFAVFVRRLDEPAVSPEHHVLSEGSPY